MKSGRDRSLNKWTVSKTQDIFTIDFHEPLSRTGPQYILLTADRHWDNPKSNRKLQEEHLKLARERNAPVIDIGDFFCAMQGKYDPRRSYDDIREEHKTDDYLGALLDTAEDWFAPYADLFAVIGTGNHESAILKNNGLNLTRQLTRKLRRHSNKDWPFAGGYGGYVNIRARTAGRQQRRKLLKFYHGSGGGGPVTKGVIQTNRRAVFMPDADIVATGHIHEEWILTMPRERVNRQGTIELHNQYHVSVPTYKEEYMKGDHGWHVERGRPPKPVGAIWIKLRHDNENRKGITSLKATFEMGD